MRRSLYVLPVATALVAGTGLAAAAAPRTGASPQPAASPHPSVSDPQDWLAEVNLYRSAAGLNPVTANTAWDTGLQHHFTYLQKTDPSLMTGPYKSAHTENPASPYYTKDGAQEGGSSDLLEGAVGYTPVQDIDT